MRLFERAYWIVISVIAGWLVAVPAIEYMKLLLNHFNLPLWTMALLGLYLTFAVKFRNIFWIFRYFRRLMR